MKNEKIIENLLPESVAASFLGYSKDHLRKEVRYKGKISYVKYARLVMYRKSDLDEYVLKHRVSARK
jgi:hypothetical protein